MLEISNLSVKIAESNILRDVTLSVPTNSFVALVGRNGAGKTTLMRSVMGLLKSAQGQICVDSIQITQYPAHWRAWHGIGYMPEDRRLVPYWTVEQNILLPAWAVKDKTSAMRLEWIYALIPEVGALSSRKAMQLSGGQQKLVALARALIAGHKLLLLDEPFEGIAPALSVRLVEILSNLRHKGTSSVLISESDLIQAEKLVDRVYSIERGLVRR